MDTSIDSSVPKPVEDAVFDAALSLEDEKEREIFLMKFFREDPAGLAQMRRLLKLSAESSAVFLEASEHGFLLAKEVLSEDPGEATAPGAGTGDVEELGERIGPYVLKSRIGEGGCGVVYEADQQEPVQRRVALKVIRLGMDTENVIKRFAAERQALALMDHPYIAHVYDAGATEAGRPYFVMERVDGERITMFCDRAKLDIEARIHLFIQVCHAIQHAHQKGVVHRDIKPSNILVQFRDGVPAPKVIDFGIAKATDTGGHSHGSLRTMQDQLIGTPPYMSPEQVDMSGIDVDTRSDVYSLGALLCELLVGHPPFDEAMLSQAGISEMRRILLEVEPPLPSRMLSTLPGDELAEVAAVRGMEPARLVAFIRGDLDWITAMALAKDRNRRYQTANALAADLRRFLDHEPVTAHRPSRLYLVGKFIRRNRLACGLGVAVAISLLGGMGASTVLYMRESEALAEQERLAKAEVRLREQAQVRAQVSQAAALLSEGKVEEADALLRESPIESIEPSREAAGVFRILGEWNAIYGRWPQARQCFLLLDQANRLDDPVRTVEDVDLLAIAATLLKDGDRQTYETFRQETLTRHLPVTNSLQAEHLLIVCLLTPADADLLERLEPVAKVCAAGIKEGDIERRPAWEAFAMTLYYFRQGNRKTALEWARKTLSYEDETGSRITATLCLTAMLKVRIGDISGAEGDVAEASLVLNPGAQFGPDRHRTFRGSWYSWVIAEILLKEAGRDITHYILNYSQPGTARN